MLAIQVGDPAVVAENIEHIRYQAARKDDALVRLDPERARAIKPAFLTVW